MDLGQDLLAELQRLYDRYTNMRHSDDTPEVKGGLSLSQYKALLGDAQLWNENAEFLFHENSVPKLKGDVLTWEGL